jgi:hypothetical protein
MFIHKGNQIKTVSFGNYGIVFDAHPLRPGVLSRCRLFLNQLETWVRVRPVLFASALFSSGFGYLNPKASALQQVSHAGGRETVRSVYQFVHNLGIN